MVKMSQSLISLILKGLAFNFDLEWEIEAQLSTMYQKEKGL